MGERCTFPLASFTVLRQRFFFPSVRLYDGPILGHQTNPHSNILDPHYAGERRRDGCNQPFGGGVGGDSWAVGTASAAASSARSMKCAIIFCPF